MATHSSILTWEILWTEEPGELQSMGSQRVRHNLVTGQNNNGGTQNMGMGKPFSQEEQKQSVSKLMGKVVGFLNNGSGSMWVRLKTNNLTGRDSG